MKRLLLVVAFTCAAAPAFAQTQVTVNPVQVFFAPSLDNDALALDGTPLVSSYEVRYYLQSGGPVIRTLNVAKPAAQNGIITLCHAATDTPPCSVVATTLFTGLPQNTVLVATVAAIGPDGSAESTPSNFFGFQGAGSRIPRAPGQPTAKK